MFILCSTDNRIKLNTEQACSFLLYDDYLILLYFPGFCNLVPHKSSSDSFTELSCYLVFSVLSGLK